MPTLATITLNIIGPLKDAARSETDPDYTDNAYELAEDIAEDIAGAARRLCDAHGFTLAAFSE